MTEHGHPPPEDNTCTSKTMMTMTNGHVEDNSAGWEGNKWLSVSTKDVLVTQDIYGKRMTAWMVWLSRNFRGASRRCQTQDPELLDSMSIWMTLMIVFPCFLSFYAKTNPCSYAVIICFVHLLVFTFMLNKFPETPHITLVSLIRQNTKTAPWGLL